MSAKDWQALHRYGPDWKKVHVLLEGGEISWDLQDGASQLYVCF
jgi:hypothetical protein